MIVKTVRSKEILFRIFVKVFIAAAILGGIAIRETMLDYKSPDYLNYVSKWYDFIESKGGFSALKHNFSDYSPAYLYILALITYLPLSKLFAIKLISIVFDFVAAFFVMLIVREKYKTGVIPYLAFCTVLLMPTVMVNSAEWGQCDIIFVSFILASVYFLQKQKKLLSVILYGIAFAFKVQAIFVAPLFLLLALKRKVTFIHLLAIPGVYLLSIIPAALAGRPFEELLSIYFDQSSLYKTLTLNAPNIYQWTAKGPYETMSKIAIGAAALFVCVMLIFIYKKMKVLKSGDVVKIALIFSLGIPFLLPSMHERYFFIADIAAVVYAFYYPRMFFVPVFVSFSSIMSYYPFLYGKTPVKLSYLPIPLLISIIAVILHLFVQNERSGKGISKKNKQNKKQKLLAPAKQRLNTAIKGIITK
ncbi:MAG: glycosyltransferase family 39 protein [Clostridia bacterium]|nr:glycosyltransferase family 39 protein [Clostridia bacterium]